MKKIPETRVSLETVDIDAIRIDPRNPREHSDRQIKQLAQSVGSFGPITPPIWRSS